MPNAPKHPRKITEAVGAMRRCASRMETEAAMLREAATWLTMADARTGTVDPTVRKARGMRPKAKRGKR